MDRTRHVEKGKVPIEGGAWSGFGHVELVEFSADGGRSWQDTRIGERVGRHGWWAWSHDWETAEPGEYELCVRATDSAGNTQPLDASEVWNAGIYGNNTVQRVPVVVR